MKEENLSTATEIGELKIPVPWGHIAAKTWGSAAHDPVLCVHGELDNAATFDKLIPLLPGARFYFVCIDLPGHGRSSHLGLGVPYRFMDYLAVLKRIVDYLDCKQIHLLGHGLGGLLGLYFSCCYPDLVGKLIVFDVVNRTVPRLYHNDQLRLNAELLLTSEMNYLQASTPVYPKQELIKKLIDWRGKGSRNTMLEDVFSRNTVVLKDGRQVLTLDPRTRFIEYPLLDDQQLHIVLRTPSCQLLIFTAKEIMKKRDILPVTSMLSIFRRNCARFEHRIVEGNHDIHLNFPERVSPIIYKFLLEVQSSL